MFSGRQNIERRYADTFKRSPIISFNCSFERNYLNAMTTRFGGRTMDETFQSQTGSVFASGDWSAIFVRGGDAWKIRVWTINQKPPPTPRAETK